MSTEYVKDDEEPETVVGGILVGEEPYLEPEDDDLDSDDSESVQNDPAYEVNVERLLSGGKLYDILD